MIHQRETDEPYLKRTYKQTEVSLEVDSDNSTLNPFFELNGEFKTSEETAFLEIKDVIISNISAVKVIIALGVRSDEQVYYIAALVEDNVQGAEWEIANQIEMCCKNRWQVFAFVAKISSARNAMNAGKRFWNVVLAQGIFICGEDVKLPNPQLFSYPTLTQRARVDWNRWGRSADGLLKGAKFYMDARQNILALTLLHQAAESALAAIISVFWGYRASAHNLNRMVRITELFTPHVAELIKTDSKVFYTLQSGYAKARYKTDFDVNDDETVIFYRFVSRIITRIDRIYRSYITLLEQKISDAEETVREE